jgi:hypothetical protein
MSNLRNSTFNISNLCCCDSSVVGTPTDPEVKTDELLQQILRITELVDLVVNKFFPKERLVGIELNPGPKSKNSNIITRRGGAVRINLSNERLCFGFPDSYRVNLRCGLSANFTVAAPAATQYVSFKGNSVTVIGPNVNGGGYNTNQPAGIAALYDASEAGPGDTAPYTKYRVYGSRITTRFTPYGTATNSIVRVVQFPCRIDAPNIGTSAYALISEQPNSQTWACPSYSTEEAKAHSLKMTTDKMFGVRPDMIEDNTYSTAGTNTPESSFYWNVYLFPDGTGTIYGNLEVVIDYDVEFYCRALILSDAP